MTPDNYTHHSGEVQHLHSTALRIHLTVEKNSRGYNYTVSVDGAGTVEQAMEQIKTSMAKLKAEYGGE